MAWTSSAPNARDQKAPAKGALFKARVGSKALLYIARCYSDGTAPPIEVDYCPHCGGKLRVRSKSISRALDVAQKWIEDGQPGFEEPAS
jgi:hypothetical protein